MKVRCIYKDSKFLKYNKIYEVLEESNKSYKVKDEDGEESNFYKWKFEEVKEMEKTFREVIADIKEGEVWVQTEEGYVTEEIYCIDGGIYLTLKQVRSVFGTSGKYKLKRKEYTFEEAFKAYEEGKEIESKSWRYKKINGKDSICSKDNDEWVTSNLAAIDIKEIRNKWYIND